CWIRLGMRLALLPDGPPLAGCRELGAARSRFGYAPRFGICLGSGLLCLLRPGRRARPVGAEGSLTTEQRDQKSAMHAQVRPQAEPRKMHRRSACPRGKRIGTRNRADANSKMT